MSHPNCRCVFPPPKIEPLCVWLDRRRYDLFSVNVVDYCSTFASRQVSMQIRLTNPIEEVRLRTLVQAGGTVRFVVAIGKTLYVTSIRLTEVLISEPIDGLKKAAVRANVVRPMTPATVDDIKEHKVSDRDRDFLYSVAGIRPRTPETVTKADVKANKFYVGHKSTIGREWGKPDIKAAIEHAKELVEQTGEDQIVVKIVKVVRRKPQPIIVEDVR